MSVRAQYTAGAVGGEEVVGLPRGGGRPGRLERPRRTRRCASRSTTGAGRACRCTCGRASAWPARSPRSPSSSSRSRTSASSRTVAQDVRPNQLVMTVQPNEGVSLSLGAKVPGTRMRIRPVNMEFLYGTAFMSQSPEAYERLILDAMRGDATLFTRNDEVEAQWRIMRPDRAGVGSEPAPAAAVRGRHRRARRRPTRTSSATTTGGDLMAIAERTDSVWSEQRHDAGGDRGGAARPARRAPRARARLRRRARAEPRLHRRPRVERRDRQPPARRRALPRVAHDRLRVRARPHDARRDGERSRPTGHAGAGRVRAHARDGRRQRRPASTSSTSTGSSTRSSSPTCRRSIWSPHGHPEAVDALLLDSPRSCSWTPSTTPTPAPRCDARLPARRRAPTSSTSPGCARRRGASASRARSTRRTAVPSSARSRR